MSSDEGREKSVSQLERFGRGWARVMRRVRKRAVTENGGEQPENYWRVCGVSLGSIFDEVGFSWRVD